MNIREIEAFLRRKERDLWAAMTRTENEGKSLGTAESQERFESAEIKEDVFQQTTSDWECLHPGPGCATAD